MSVQLPNYGPTEFFLEYRRIIGSVLFFFALALMLALKSATLAELSVHAVMVAGLILLFSGGTSSGSGSMAKDLCASLERSASNNVRLSGELGAAIAQASKNQATLDRLREDMKVERKVMQEMKAEADLLQRGLNQSMEREGALRESLVEAKAQAQRSQENAESLAEQVRLLRSEQENRLARMLPEGILSSRVRDDVMGCFDSASERSDPPSILLMASLQALAAVRLGNLPSDNVSSYLKAVGEALFMLCQARHDGPEEVSRVFNEWARVLNDCAANDYSVFVPTIGAPADLDKMAGIERGNVRMVLCWGVRSNNRGVEYPAQVN